MKPGPVFLLHFSLYAKSPLWSAPAIWLKIKVASLSRPSCKKIWKVDKNSASEINCHDLLTYLFAVVEPWKDWNLSPQEISCNRWNYVNCLMIKRILNKYKAFFGAFKFCYSKSLKIKTLTILGQHSQRFTMIVHFFQTIH